MQRKKKSSDVFWVGFEGNLLRISCDPFNKYYFVLYLNSTLVCCAYVWTKILAQKENKWDDPKWNRHERKAAPYIKWKPRSFRIHARWPGAKQKKAEWIVSHLRHKSFDDFFAIFSRHSFEIDLFLIFSDFVTVSHIIMKFKLNLFFLLHFNRVLSFCLDFVCGSVCSFWGINYSNENFVKTNKSKIKKSLKGRKRIRRCCPFEYVIGSLLLRKIVFPFSIQLSK